MTRNSERGSPRRSFRWRPRTFTELYELSTDTGVSVNHVAQVAANWGLVFLRSVDPRARNRLLGVKGTKPLTSAELDEYKDRTIQILSEKANTVKKRAIIGIRVSRDVKALMLERKRSTRLTLTEQVRRGDLTRTETPNT